jgi:hypothetical protein
MASVAEQASAAKTEGEMVINKCVMNRAPHSYNHDYRSL